jgi:hypothetical protein
VARLRVSLDAVSDRRFRRRGRHGFGSGFVENGERRKIRRFSQHAFLVFEARFLLTLPSACGLVVLGEPIIRLIYERGKFHEGDTTMTAYALAGYSIGLTGYAAIKVLSPAFYALERCENADDYSALLDCRQCAGELRL